MKIFVAGALLCALTAPIWAQDAPPAAKPPAVKPPAAKPDAVKPNPANPETVEPQTGQPMSATPQADKKAPPTIGAGELRLDGKIKAMLNVGEWQMEAISWTSPRDVMTPFSDPKSKTIKIGADAYIHPVNETDKVALKDVKLGTRIAVIGKNSADGSLSAREVILLEGYGSRKTVGSLSSNPFTSALVRQSRKAREEGNLPVALKLAESAVTAAQGINDLSGEGLATQDKTLLLMDMGEVEAAGKSAERVEAIGRSLSNSLLIAMGMNTRGRVLAETGELDKAIQVFEAADPISAGSEPAIQLSTLSGLAQVYGQAERTTDLVATLQRIFPLEESLRQRDDATGTLLSLARTLAPTDATKAREYLTQATPRIDEAADEKKRAALRNLSARAKYALADKDGAKADFEAAATLYEGTGDTKRAETARGAFAKMEAKVAAKPGAPTAPVANDTNEGDQ